MWVIIGMFVGFMAPVCACISLIVISAFSFNSLLGQLQDADEEEGDGIGIIDLTGPISTGDGFGATTGNLQTQLEWMNDQEDVKAVVIRANSPGGGVNASDEIWDMVRSFDKPIVVYVHGTCASGCLYIASAADEIIASRNSQIGSIGVISTFFNVSELMDDIGVEVDVVITGENKDFGSPFREITEEERAFWQEQIELILDNFIEVVANRDGSNLTEADVRVMATGQVWVASQALDLELIDSIGYEDDAVRTAARLATIRTRNIRTIEYPFDFNLFELFGSPFLGSAEGYFDLPTAEDVLETFQQPALQYRYYGPYDRPASSVNTFGQD
jgi:protease-4